MKRALLIVAAAIVAAIGLLVYLGSVNQGIPMTSGEAAQRMISGNPNTDKTTSQNVEDGYLNSGASGTLILVDKPTDIDFYIHCTKYTFDKSCAPFQDLIREQKALIGGYGDHVSIIESDGKASKIKILEGNVGVAGWTATEFIEKTPPPPFR